MRLLNTTTLRLEFFIGDQIPQYAILSHTWGEDEFLFEDLQGDMQAQLRNPKRGLRKVLQTCERAKVDKFKYAWIDTCCIDKSSSAELSEAINSMFRWYEDSAACYIYLEDVTLEADGTFTHFDSSNWFSRGWTLQELIAPHEAEFFDKNWNYLSNRSHLASRLAANTAVDWRLLARSHETFDRSCDPLPGAQIIPDVCKVCHATSDLRYYLGLQSIATKMRWAARRRTTRQEDVAYSLLGLFNINMPLLYGEGAGAFLRLQEEIIKKHPADQSILVWVEESRRNQKLLAQSPSAFDLDDIIKMEGTPGPQRATVVLTPRGLELNVVLTRGRQQPQMDEKPDPRLSLAIAILDCQVNGQIVPRVGIFVRKMAENEYHREYSHSVVLFSSQTKTGIIKLIEAQQREVIYSRLVSNLISTASLPRRRFMESVVLNVQANNRFSLVSSYPSVRKVKDGTMTIDPSESGFEINRMRVWGILRFSQEPQGDFAVLWGQEVLTEQQNLSAGTVKGSSLCCTIVDWSLIRDTQRYGEGDAVQFGGA
ncbi:hypothetical protein ACHAQA_006594 [Verticillium albo-atrum]